MSVAAEVRVEKRFRHPVERVFDAFLDPERVGDWLFRTPDGLIERADCDPRPGGAFAIFERRGHQVAHHWGQFIEIDRPRRVVFDFWVDEAPTEKTRVTVTFASDGDDAVVVLTHDLAPAWAAYRDRSVHGWTTILDGLARVIAPHP